MTEPTPRQKRTDQLLEQAREAHRKSRDEHQFITSAFERGGITDVQLVIALTEASRQQHNAIARLVQTIENMAGAPCFDKQPQEA